MKVYIDITLLPGVDVGLHFLWEKLYQQIHLALVEVKDVNGTTPIAVAFPEYNSDNLNLGKKLRLLAESQTQLEMLDIQKWLARLSDYLHITKVREVPENVLAYACFKRMQGKSNIERLARRKSRREGIDEAEALQKLASFKEERINAPFIKIQSLSSGHRFRLFIVRDTIEKAVVGRFSLYGLSSKATVPLF